MHNICIDVLRSRRSEPLSSLGKQGPASENAEHLIGLKDTISHIRTAVAKLPIKQRTIIELHDFQEFSYDEIADVLDMEVNAVRVNLSRARAKIVAQFKKEEIYE